MSAGWCQGRGWAWLSLRSTATYLLGTNTIVFNNKQVELNFLIFIKGAQRGNILFNSVEITWFTDKVRGIRIDERINYIFGDELVVGTCKLLIADNLNSWLVLRTNKIFFSCFTLNSLCCMEFLRENMFLGHLQILLLLFRCK